MSLEGLFKKSYNVNSEWPFSILDWIVLAKEVKFLLEKYKNKLARKKREI